MISFPNAKINLGLRIISKRNDGYHRIQSLMIPVGLSDILEFAKSEKDCFQSSGLIIPGESDSNLVLKALHLIRQEYKIPSLDIHLHKKIPMGAGLGGGSSNAAFMIKMLNSEFNLGISTEKMKKQAALLGSDCSFFIENKTKLVEGTGEILSNFALDLKGLNIVLIDPGFPVSTAEAYSNVKLNEKSPDLKEILSLAIPKWKSKLVNDFEKSLFKKFPVLSEIKNLLYAQGALYAAMSGSGSVMYGLFEFLPEDFRDIPGKVIYKGRL